MRLLFTKPKTSPVYSFLTIPLLLASAVADSHAASYTINPANTHIRFSIERFKNSTTTGGFYDIRGQLQYNPSLKTGDISLIIPIDSLNTGNPSFNDSLTGPDFFDVQQYPSAHFKSTKWHFNRDKKSPQVSQIDGQLTLHGETHPISLTATKFDCYLNTSIRKYVCGGDFTATIDRTKWNIHKFSWFGLTKNLALNIKVEATKQ
ncbi:MULTISPECIES: YceI family protein [unclassified Psychrobacter]|uniref:YceI family protein n=1 Tax=unclassified Psychrobacter TaxID=196806 RepID=UPI0025B4A85F|nr:MULTISPECIES: YceI family protein [unclassified Psychrobacter]MDN3452993.1 YceI family protein [Psychrobacter sp. APC 3350]MDN3502988.1 YceI family protein [Psychrobacter sp. 5A.1]